MAALDTHVFDRYLVQDDDGRPASAQRPNA
jgi:hypothetical protein